MTETTNRTRTPTLTMEQSIRGWADVLGLWRLCNNPRCKRTRACRGEAVNCFKAHFPLLPESVQLWFHEIGQAQEDGLSFDEAIECMEDTPAEGALERWHDAIAQAVDVQKASRRKSAAATGH